MPWRPGELTARSDDLEEPFEDIPEHLSDQLHGWIERQLSRSSAATVFVGLHFRLAIPDATRQHVAALGPIMGAVYDDDNFALSVIEAILTNPSEAQLQSSAIADLDRLLTFGNSAYAVRREPLGIEMRTLPETRQLVDSAVAAATGRGSVSAHLENAWNAAFSISPSPAEAYREAVMAVEGASIPVVAPNQDKATLGHVIGDLRANQATWRVALAADDGFGVETVIAMLQTLWTGQTRHAGMDPTQPETVQAAQAAVFLSSTLVQWFISGAVHR